MTERPQNRMSEDRSVAVLLLAIDHDLAAEVVRRMHDDQLARVTRAMKELQEVAVGQSTISQVFEDTVKRLHAGGMALGDVSTTMEAMLTKALGSERGLETIRRASTEILAKRPFAVFEALTPEDLANILLEEHPQIAAVFLAHLDRQKAGKVIANLPESRRPDLILRVATLDRTPPEVVQRVLEVMRKKVKDLGLTNLRSEPKGWVKAAASILNNLGGGEKAILEEIAKVDEAVSASLREEMFTFEDLAGLDKKAMQKILGSVDTRVLAVSLKAAPQEVEDTVFNNLSKRAADMVREERDNLGPMPLAEVVEAQQQILASVRDLMDKGEIKATKGAEQMV